MRVEGTCQLHCTPAELSRGSIVCGKLDSQKTAAFVTAVSAENTAMTNILLCRGGRLLNTGADRKPALRRCSIPPASSGRRTLIMMALSKFRTPRKAIPGRQARFFAWYRF